MIGRHIFGKIPEFRTISLKSKKQIRGLQKRGVPPVITAAQSARDQNATEMKCEIRNDSREDENESNVKSGVVSENMEGMTIDSEIEETGGNKGEKTGVKAENERNVHGRVLSGDNEGVQMTDTAIEQTGGNSQEKLERREDEKERNVKGEAVNQDIESVIIDTDIEDTEIENTGENKAEKIEKEDEKERNVHGGTVGEDVEGAMTDTEIGRQDEKEKNIHGEVVRDKIADVMTDTEIMQTGGIREEKIGRKEVKEREEVKERNVNGRAVSEDVHNGAVSEDNEGVTIDTEIEETTGIKEEKTGVDDRNVKGGVVSEDIEGVTIDSEIKQTDGNTEEKIGKRDENERNVNSGMFSDDFEDVTIDTEEEQTWCDMNAMQLICDGDLDSDNTDPADEVTLKHPCTIASAEDMFCNRVMLSSRQWNNANVKALKPQELDCQSFKQHLSFSVPKPLPRVNSVERMLIYQSSGYSTNHSNNCLRAFLIKAFPPVQVCNAAAKDFSSLTFPNDVLPQFTGTCHSSIRNRTRFSIRCVVCPLYQERCTRQGIFSKLSSCGDVDLDGVSQAVIHHKLRLHQSALAYFSGSSATVTTVESNLDRDVRQTHQRTIFQALKMKESNTTSKVAHCLGFFENQEIVESYKDSSNIRRMTAKTLFQRERSKGKFQCFHKVGHENCVTWAGWKEIHVEEAANLTESRSSRAAYVTVNRKVHYDGKSIQVNAAIKSLDPPCSGKPSGNISHPFTCDNCYNLQHYLLDLHKKRSQAKLTQKGEGRVGKRGFRLDYATQTELKRKLHTVTSEKRNLEKTVVTIRKQQRDVQSWEEMLHNSCKHDYQEKLIVDLLALFREDIDIKKPVQVTVLTNLVGKLKGNVNHKYIPLIKMIAKLHKTRLGETNYDLMSVSM